MKIPQNVNANITADTIKEAIVDFILQNKKFPKQDDLLSFGITYLDIYFYCGGIKRAIESIPQDIYEYAKNEETKVKQNIIIQDLQDKLSLEHHSQPYYLRNGGRYFGSIPTYFGSWNNAVKAAFPTLDLTKPKKEKIIKPKRKKIGKQDVIEFLESYIKINKTIPMVKDFSERRIYNYCCQHLGGIQKSLSLINPALIQLIKDKKENDVIADIRQKLSPDRLSMELFEEKGGNSYRAIEIFGNWDSALRASFTDEIVNQWNKSKLDRKLCTKEEYLQDFIETSIIYGNCTKTNYIQHGKYNVCTYEPAYFKSHKNLIKEAAKISSLFCERCFANKRLPVPVSEPQYFEVPYKKRKVEQEPYPLPIIIEEAENYYFANNRKIHSYDYVNQLKKIPQKIINRYGGWKKFISLTRIPEFEKTRLLEQFFKEKEMIIQKYGRFSMKLHKAEPGTLHHQSQLVQYFGSMLEFRKAAGLEITEQCISNRFTAYAEKEYSDFLWKIYNKYGFISCSLIDNEPNHIKPERIRKRFGSLEAACKHFGVPYKAPAHRSKFYFEIETKACNYLQIPCIQEKTWPWLRYKSRLRCDLFFPLLNLVIEIDGPQHYKNFRFFHETNEKYYTALKRDQIKNEELPKHGIDLIRIDSRNIRQIEQILRPFREKRDLIYDLCAF